MTAALCCAVVELAGRPTGRWFFLGCGAFAAAAGSLFSLMIETQLCLFLAISALCWGIERLFAMHMRNFKRAKVQDLIGKCAQVVQPIAPGLPGAIAIEGNIWSAQADLPVVVLAGTRVLVVSENEEIVIVRPLTVEADQLKHS